jgi:hypothetical protein
MEPEFDREIDALLRTRAGDGRSKAVDTTSARGVARDHLDVDELAAFAENALPAATRTRYFAHLADCDDCRRTATRLALAANVAHVQDAGATAEANKNLIVDKIDATSWRERVAALLSPRAWRYAMPVVALLCVGVIALVVMRRVPNAGVELARNDEELQRSRAVSSVAHDENHATANEAQQSPEGATQGQNNDAPVASKQAASGTARGETKASDDQVASQSASGAGGGTAGSSSGGAPVDTVTRRVEELPSVTQSPANTPAPVPPPASREAQSLSSLASQATPVPPVNEDRLEIAKEEKIKKSAEVVEVEQAQPKGRRARDRDESDNQSVNGQRSANRTTTRNAPAAPTASAGANAASKPSPRQAAPAREDSRKDDDQSSDVTRAKSLTSETRTVAGRKFRREGDAWIDTAYKSGEATTVVRRNSEQFRALVADEPEIGRVAKALGGEVVVVWRGHAYRIKS